LLAARGYRVTGIDVSPAMIAHAKANLPAAEFRVCDAARFRFPARFDAAVSTFDSLNHILDQAGLDAAFRNTAAALKPGAAFVFDMLLESAYQTNWADSFSVVRDDHVLLISGSGFDFRTRLAHCKVTMFRLLDGVWRRSDVDVVERCYATGEIDSALRRAGFGNIECYDARDLGMAGQLGEGRTFFVAARTATSG
jgi:SAM-dependent methyltransferase